MVAEAFSLRRLEQLLLVRGETLKAHLGAGGQSCGIPVNARRTKLADEFEGLLGKSVGGDLANNLAQSVAHCVL